MDRGSLQAGSGSTLGKGCHLHASRVFRKTLVDYICCLFPRGVDGISLLLNPSSLVIMKHRLLSVPSCLLNTYW